MRNLHTAIATLLLTVLVGHTTTMAQTYADHSRMATARWVRISVPVTGFYELTDSLIRTAGFDHPEQVKVYGYGGSMQPEKLSADYLTQTDDLPQVPTCTMAGRRLFYAVGTTGWNTPEDNLRQRNPYSDKGCYFLADTDEEPLLADSTSFIDSHYPTSNDYHSLYEVDNFAWYHGGRNLYDRRLFGAGVSRSYTLPAHPCEEAQLTVVMSYNGYCEATVSVDGVSAGTILINEQNTKGTNKKEYLDTYSKAAADVWTFPIDSIAADSITVTITQVQGADMRLDYLSLCFSQPRPLPSFATTALPQPNIEGPVDCQDLHADRPANMVIIIPASGKLASEAERLAQLHREYDSLSVRVVRADQLYNEFSSGTPDANAYRRYLRMLRDRAANSDADNPRFLLLMGDGVYDNRMLTSDFSQLDATDFLLCYESENSFSETNCFVTDDFFTMLDNNDGADIVRTDKSDMAVGRMPARTDSEAKVLVDKAISYRQNNMAGAWQNTICFMGDDGNANMHMNDAETVATLVQGQWPSYNVKKIYWDAYERTETSTGYAYPDVTKLILQQMRDGALLMNYSGHGGPTLLSHERVVLLNDFKRPTSLRLPVWFTASCDVAPFDGAEENIAEEAIFNPQGGAIAFIGTTRTVYAQHNRSINKAFTQYLLSTDGNGRPLTIGEALSKAKNDQVKSWGTSKQAGTNRLHFTLLGDPALSAHLPTAQVIIDSINGLPVEEAMVLLTAGDTATVTGHISGHDSFNGLASLTVKDAMQTITCRMNPLSSSESPKAPLVYKDRPMTIFTGNDSVRNGRFTFTFAVPKDISYSDEPGQMLIHAVDDTRELAAHGNDEHFVMGSADSYEMANADGPIINAWLDKPTFRTGDATSSTPLFHADLYDEDGINASGCGIGHDLEIIVDGQMSRTYNLNSYFNYDFSNFRSGYIDYTLPMLADGEHTLLFRCWDVLNNSAAVTLHFIVGNSSVRADIDEVSATQHNIRDRRQGYFDLQGRQATANHHGLLIWRSPDGKVKKMMRRRQ